MTASHPFEDQDRPATPVKALRPRDAATIVMVDRSGSALKVLMGRRARAHVFMPDLFVFPGGRRDRSDTVQPFSRDLHPDVLQRLAGASADDTAFRRARGLAFAAVRELHEETGLVVGNVERRRGVDRLAADLGSLRYIARAITPPGNVRRFDTRFFCTFADEAGIDPTNIQDSTELTDLQWLDMDGISHLKLPSITRTILDLVKDRMRSDPSLPFGGDGPFYYARHGRFHRGSI